MKRFFVVLIAVILFSSCADSGREKPVGISDFNLPALDGSTVRLSDNGGKVILIDFWATWCVSCREMVPVLSKLHKKYSEKGLVVLGISLDEDGLEVVESFVRESGIPYKVLLGNEKTIRAFGGVTVLPTLMIINREGRLAGKMLGYHSFGELEDQVKKFL